MAKRKRTKG